MGPGLAVPEVAVVRRRWALDRLEPAPERESARELTVPIPVGSRTAILITGVMIEALPKPPAFPENQGGIGALAESLGTEE